MPGATPSGGYAAQQQSPGGIGGMDRMSVLVAIIVAAAVLLLILIYLLATRGDEGSMGDDSYNSATAAVIAEVDGTDLL